MAKVVIENEWRNTEKLVNCAADSLKVGIGKCRKKSLFLRAKIVTICFCRI